jgi:RNA polymerase sigma-70 factor, ECF subfamily
MLEETAVTPSGDLLERARSGDADAFCELCRKHETRLLRQATALCGDANLAEDLAQETLLEGWKCLQRYNGRCQFFTWLCAILLNRYRNSVRGKRFVFLRLLGLESESYAEHEAQMTTTEAWPDQAAELREQAELLRKCVLALPRKHQQVIYLRFYVDDCLEGIAAAVGCSVGTVKSRLYHALDKLRGMSELRKQRFHSDTR